MIEFRSADPFPHVDAAQLTPSQMRAHSVAVDQWLGFRLGEIETRLASHGSNRKASGASGERQELWFGLETQMLLTPYLEIRAILEELAPQPNETVVDLGAAYGRMGFVIARCFKQVLFTGYEYVGERVEEGRRVLAKNGLPSSWLEHCDLVSKQFELRPASYYFLYDFGTPKAIEKVLYDLQRIARTEAAQGRAVTIIARGRHSRSLIASRHSWLVPRFSPQGERKWTIYAAAGVSNLRCKTA